MKFKELLLENEIEGWEEEISWIDGDIRELEAKKDNAKKEWSPEQFHKYRIKMDKLEHKKEQLQDKISKAKQK